jgi:hypothetical protein
VIVIGLVVLFLVALGWRRTMADTDDLAEAIVGLSARRLASTRPGWGQAMAAELSALDDRRTRWRFALGCARTALLPPLADGSTAPGARFLVVAVVGTVIGLGLLVQRQVQAAPAFGRHGASYEIAVTVLFLALIALHAWLVDRRARETSARAAAARRSGITAGIVLGALALLLSLPLPDALSSSRLSTVAAILPFPLLLVGCALTGVMATRVSGDSASGHEAGVWAGRVAGSIMAIGLLAATLWASGWFVHDPATISEYRETFSPEHFANYHTHFRTIAGFVSSENVDTALISVLLLFPLIGFVFGALGGHIGPLDRQQSHDLVEN